MDRCVSVRRRGKVWNDYMERIMTEENDWDHNMEEDAAEGPEGCACRDEVIHPLS